MMQKEDQRAGWLHGGRWAASPRREPSERLTEMEQEPEDFIETRAPPSPSPCPRHQSWQSCPDCPLSSIHFRSSPASLILTSTTFPPPSPGPTSSPLFAASQCDQRSTCPKLCFTASRGSGEKTSIALVALLPDPRGPAARWALVPLPTCPACPVCPVCPVCSPHSSRRSPLSATQS